MNSVLESKNGIQQAEGDTTSESKGTLRLLRRFHFGEPAAVGKTTRPAPTVLPALLNAYRDASVIRYQYPLYLAPVGDRDVAKLARPISEFFGAALQTFAPGEEDARILRDNLPWLERYLKDALGDAGPSDAADLFAQAAAAMQAELDLNESAREKLQSDLGQLADAIAKGGQFLGYGPGVPLHLLLHAIRHRDSQRRAQLRERIDNHVHGLEALLDVEKSKSAEANEPGNIQSSVGLGSRYFNSGALSGMLEQRAAGSVEMSTARRVRIEAALGTLQAWQDDAVIVRFVGRVEGPGISVLPEVHVVDSDDPCTTAAEVFEQDAAEFATLFAALRIAALEIDSSYDPAIHDSWFANFDWQSFSDDELQLVTRVFALVSAAQLAGDGLPSFSRMLGSRLPVHVLTSVRAYDNPGARPDEGPFDAYRFELGYFGVGHRQAVVAQTSAARHDDLLAGFLCALDSNRTSLHLINRGTQSRVEKPVLDPWFVASAALESRAHPFVLVNPDAGDHAAERVSFGGNPQADSDWPVEKLEYRDAAGDTTEMELAFTFADYALLMPALHDHFRVIPADLVSEDLLPIDQYLDADDEIVDRAVPFVWAIDAEGVLLRLAVSRALVFACRDRLNYWHTLQELAGVQNFYVEEAIDRIIEEQRIAIEAERDQLQKDHEEALESVRTEAAGEAMGQLVDFLMGADLSGMVAGGSPVVKMPATAPAGTEAPVEAEAEPAVEAAGEPEEELSFDEPWLDTAACTTCDDCISINKMMFAYNEDKQAYIRDVNAGTYADLVAAAEICPAKCIHPGKPLDPNEPGLDELIARAEPFN
ncbi:MAG: ferredoxin [Woeseiaceae bacterium]|nr:ferredoxin [Woeseiaceae bacterium]